MSQKVLIVDDESCVVESVRDFLSDFNYTVIVAKSVNQAIQTLKNDCKIDVVITDIMIPEKSGFELIKYIHEYNDNIPVIVLSAINEATTVVQAVNLGAWDYIVKPINDLNVLKTVINKCITKRDLIIDNKEYHKALEERVENANSDIIEHKKKLEVVNVNLLNEIEKNRMILNDLQESRKYYKKMQKEVKKSESNLLFLADNIETGFFISGNSGEIEYKNAAWDKIFQIDIQQSQNLKWYDYIEKGEKIFDEISTDVNKKEWYFEVPVGKIKNSLRWVELTVAKTVDENNFVRYIGTAEDTTDKRKYVSLLIAERDQLLSIFDSLSEIVYVIDLDTFKMLYANKYLRTVIQHNYYNKKCYEVIAGISEKCSWCPNNSLKDLKNNIIETEYVNTYFGRDYSAVFKRISWTQHKRAVMCFAMDITHIKKKDAIIRESEERFRQIANNIRDVFWMADVKKKFYYISPSFESVTGYSCSEVINGDLIITNLVIKEDLEIINNAWKTVLEKGYDIEYRINDKNNKEKWIREKAFPIKDKNKETQKIAGVSADITEFKEASLREKKQQEIIRQNEKMASIGTLVSGVAHEINNPNNFIMLNSSLLNNIFGFDSNHIENNCFDLENIANNEETTQRLLNGISQGSIRIKRIVDSLKDFSGKDSMDYKTPNSINSIIESAVLIMREKIDNSTKNFILKKDGNLPLIKVDSQRLEQVFINLIDNSCSCLESENDYILVSTRYIENKSAILITVKDQGRGLSSDEKKYLFDPFFTTKRDKGGIGMGLTISYSIINDHKGKIAFNDNKPKGTAVVIELPVERNGIDII